MPSNISKKQKCPKCKNHAGLELIYDVPNEKDVEKVRRGLAVPGGCKPKGVPVYKWNCGNCGHVWGESEYCCDT